jgi:hypothetical protein
MADDDDARTPGPHPDVVIISDPISLPGATTAIDPVLLLDVASVLHPLFAHLA